MRGNNIMPERDPFSESDEGMGDSAPPASTVGGTPVANAGDQQPADLPPDTAGMENVQQLPGEGTPNMDIELPPAAGSDNR
jgi:hypothetical protein